MKKYALFLIAFVLFLFPSTSFAININKSVYEYGENVFFTSTGGAWVVYDITANIPLGGLGSYTENDDISPVDPLDFTINNNFSVIETSVDGICENLTYNYTECKTSIYFIDESLFTVIPPNDSSSIMPNGGIFDEDTEIIIFLDPQFSNAWASYTANDGTQKVSNLAGASDFFPYFINSTTPEPFHILLLNTYEAGSGCYDLGVDYDECITTYSSEVIADYLFTPAPPQIISFVSFPAATTTLSSIGEWSGGLFDQMGEGGLVEMIAGIIIAGMTVVFIAGALQKGIKKATNHR